MITEAILTVSVKFQQWCPFHFRQYGGQIFKIAASEQATVLRNVLAIFLPVLENKVTGIVMDRMKLLGNSAQCPSVLPHEPSSRNEKSLVLDSCSQGTLYRREK